jgi:hypothetical protein
MKQDLDTNNVLKRQSLVKQQYPLQTNKTDKSKTRHNVFWREPKLQPDRPCLKNRLFQEKSISLFFHTDEHESEHYCAPINLIPPSNGLGL